MTRYTMRGIRKLKNTILLPPIDANFAGISPESIRANQRSMEWRIDRRLIITNRFAIERLNQAFESGHRRLHFLV